MGAEHPNMVLFWWDNVGYGIVGCYGGGRLLAAPTWRIDGSAAEGKQLLPGRFDKPEAG